MMLSEADYQAAARGGIATAAALRAEVERTGLPLSQVVDLAAVGMLGVVPPPDPLPEVL